MLLRFSEPTLEVSFEWRIYIFQSSSLQLQFISRHENHDPIAVPSSLHQDISILQHSPDFVDDYLNLGQQPVVTSPYSHITFHPVVGEVGEDEHAARPHVETWAVVRLDNPTSKGPAGVWSIEVTQSKNFDYFCIITAVVDNIVKFPLFWIEFFFLNKWTIWQAAKRNL